MTDTRDSVIAFLTSYNKWRRGDEEIKQPDPKEIGENIDAAIKMLTALQSGAGDGWSGWAVQYPNKLPYLYGAKEIALLNYDPESDARLIYLMEAIDNAQATEGK